MGILIDIILLGFLVCTALAVAYNKNLFTAAMLTGIYSLLSAAFFVLMDAVDVAFTEASVGAGIATLLLLSTLALTGYNEKPTRLQPKRAIIIVTLTGGLLLYGTYDLPAFGSAAAPAHRHVAPRYIEASTQETGVPNMVTAVLASYRGFDTFGETIVIFTAGIGVLALLGLNRTNTQHYTAMLQHKILRIVGKMLIPLILLFALYVQFHGDYGPGGGFQAGVIFAAGFILYTMLFGLHAVQKVIKPAMIELLAATGVLIYGSVGIVSMLNGGSFLDYNVLAADPVQGQHLGIFLVELGVGITVAAIMLLIFFTFTNRNAD